METKLIDIATIGIVVGICAQFLVAAFVVCIFIRITKKRHSKLNCICDEVRKKKTTEIMHQSEECKPELPFSPVDVEVGEETVNSKENEYSNRIVQLPPKKEILSHIPRGCFRIIRDLQNNSQYIRIPSKSGRELEKNGYILWKIDYNHRRGKTFIVFSKEPKKGFQYIVVRENDGKKRDSCKSFSLGNRDTLERLERLMCKTLYNAQLLQIINYNIQEDGDLWVEIIAGEIHK